MIGRNYRTWSLEDLKRWFAKQEVLSNKNSRCPTCRNATHLAEQQKATCESLIHSEDTSSALADEGGAKEVIILVSRKLGPSTLSIVETLKWRWSLQTKPVEAVYDIINARLNEQSTGNCSDTAIQCVAESIIEFLSER